MTVFSELAMRPHADLRSVRGWNASIPARLVLTICATALLLVGANLATPLYPLLQERLGLGPFAVTLTFSSYVLALILGLVLYGLGRTTWAGVRAGAGGGHRPGWRNHLCHR